ncbi:MAG TPA: extracellular solute-binding protein [Fibrobacteraceae bacterium]|nr:extracellular solute-binding protein [Fibrobacteraceae bacterium]
MSERQHLQFHGFRKVMLRVVLVGLAFLLLSCRQDAPTGQTRITIWVLPNFPDPQRDMEKLVKTFTLEHPGIEVEITVLDWGSAWTKITTAATAQNGPDLIQLGSTWTAAVTEMGALVPLDSLLLRMGGENAFVEAGMESARPRASDSVTSLPWFLDVRPMYYRKDVLAKMGISPDSIQNWDDFVRALTAIREAKPVVEGNLVLPIGYPGKNDWNVIHNMAPWIWGAGGDFLDSTATHSAIAEPASIRGILFYLNLVRQGFNERRNLEKNTAQVSSDFDEGRLAFWLDATTKTIYLDRPQFLGGTGKSAAARNYACMLPPTSPDGHARYFVGGSNLAIFKFSKHRPEAMLLLEYLVGRPDIQQQMSRASGFLPALRETYDMPYFRENHDRQVFQRMVQQGRAYPSVHYWGEIETSILSRRLGNIFDLITAAKPGEWPEDKVIQEIRATDTEITRYIAQQLDHSPGLRERLQSWHRRHP